jgi:P27 family predicted phage terminase small subunit
MGRNKKPTAQHKAEGTYRSDRHETGEPDLVSIRLSSPRSFDPKKRAIWKELNDVLADRMHVLTFADKTALHLLTDRLYEYHYLAGVIGRRGRTYKFTNRQGVSYDIMRPEVKMRDEAWKDCVRLMGKFGLTPADRRNVSVVTRTKLDEIEKRKSKNW